MRYISILGPALSVAVIVAAAVAGDARAGEGEGGNQCPWGADLNFNLDGKKVTVPQSLFTAKTKQMTVGGIEVVVDPSHLKLVFVTSNGDTWQASLTMLEAGKRCTAFYAGTAYPVGRAVPVVSIDPFDNPLAGNR